MQNNRAIALVNITVNVTVSVTVKRNMQYNVFYQCKFSYTAIVIFPYFVLQIQNKSNLTNKIQLIFGGGGGKMTMIF